MPRNPARLSRAIRFMIALTTLAFAATTIASAQFAPTTLYTFPSNFPGVAVSGLVRDGSGNLFGTTVFQGSCGNPELCGTVFELSPASGGGWTQTTIYSATQAGQTFGFPLVMDGAGNLYGVAYSGGTSGYYCSHGCGSVFELSPTSGGWTYTVLHNFDGGNGGNPNGALILDGAGNLYGTTQLGGTAKCCGRGVIYQLSPTAGGWVETVLHRFTGGTDGGEPLVGPVMDGSGNLFGTASLGGNSSNFGTIYKLTSNGSGGFHFQTIHTFIGGAKGNTPVAPVIVDGAGNLYGTTLSGGSTKAFCTTVGCGIAFELAVTSAGGYAEKVLRIFQPTVDGSSPQAGLIFDTAGNLYGTTVGGGKGVLGSVFELSPAGATWTETILYTGSSSTLGGFTGGVIRDSAGNLYGPSNGTKVFELSPTP